MLKGTKLFLFMIGYFLMKRTSKPYIIIPLFLYACAMYRMLGGTCGSRRKNDEHKDTGDTNSISFQFNKNDNTTAILVNLTKDYQRLERRRQLIFHSLKNVLNSLDSDKYSGSLISNILNQQFIDAKVSNRIPTNLEMNRVSKASIKYSITCENIHEVQIKTQIGHGVSKQTYSGDFHGHVVAVKMVTRHQKEVKSCIDKINASSPDAISERNRCFTFSNMKLMKEILLLEQLHHPGFVPLLGYCIRNEDSDTTDLSERGIVSVYEIGSRISVYRLQTLPWQQRLQHALEIAQFLHYLEFSPLGSLRVRDFKQDHFLMVNDSIKMIDLDDVDNLEPSCSVYINVEAQAERTRNGQSNGCEFNLPCQKGLCIGFNAKQNLLQMNSLILKHLLFPLTFPKEIGSELGELSADLDGGQVTTAMLANRIAKIKPML